MASVHFKFGTLSVLCSPGISFMACWVVCRPSEWVVVKCPDSVLLNYNALLTLRHGNLERDPM